MSIRHAIEARIDYCSDTEGTTVGQPPSKRSRFSGFLLRVCIMVLVLQAVELITEELGYIEGWTIFEAVLLWAGIAAAILLTIYYIWWRFFRRRP